MQPASSDRSYHSLTNHEPKKDFNYKFLALSHHNPSPSFFGWRPLHRRQPVQTCKHLLPYYGDGDLLRSSAVGMSGSAMSGLQRLQGFLRMSHRVEHMLWISALSGPIRTDLLPGVMRGNDSRAPWTQCGRAPQDIW